MKNAQLYRKKAVEAFHEREDSQQGIRIIMPIAWIYLLLFLLLFSAGLIWLFLGQITTVVEGQGIVLAKNAEIINTMSPITGGYVQALLVGPGMKVKKGQLIATLVNPNIAGEAKELNNYLEQERVKLNELRLTAKREIAIRLKHIDESINYAQTIAANLKEKKEHLESLLKIQEVAFKKGILSRLELNDMQVAYFDAKNQITKNQDTLVELNQSKNDYIEAWNAKIREQQEKVSQAELNLRKTSENLKLTQKVLSPAAGIVSSAYVKPGDFLTEKQTLLDIIIYSKQLEVVAFFNEDVGKKIKVRMSAKVFPKHLNALEYGGIVGQVSFISELPISPKNIENLLANPKLIETFEPSDTVFRTRIELVTSPTTVSGYLWTTSKGPNEKLSIGTVATVRVLVKKQKPLSLIIPMVRSAKNWMLNKNGQI